MKTAMVTAMGNEKTRDPAEILKRPYHRVIVPEEDGSFSALISEFSGCLAIGDSVAETYATLEEVAEGWLLAAIANSRPIPDPIEEPEYSGKLALRLPKSLHETAANAAERDDVSLNQYIVAAVAIYTGANEARRPMMVTSNTYNYFHLATLPGQPVLFMGAPSQSAIYASGIELTQPLRSVGCLKGSDNAGS